MILCHKCAGLLIKGPAPLYECRCISGYIRGFEPDLTTEEALDEQVKQTKDSLALYRGQGRPKDGQHVRFMLNRLVVLEGYKV